MNLTLKRIKLIELQERHVLTEQSKSTAGRRIPSQARSKTTVEQILKVTGRLLKTAGFAKITTSLIADKANISTGSLYQYFRNKEAIFFTLYDEYLLNIRTTVDGFNQEPFLSLPREEFFDSLLSAIKEAAVQSGMHVELEKAINAFPSLESLSEKHAELISDQLAFFFRYYGSTWPIEELRKLALFGYYSNYGVRHYRQHLGTEHAVSSDWERRVYKTIFEFCFESSSPEE